MASWWRSGLSVAMAVSGAALGAGAMGSAAAAADVAVYYRAAQWDAFSGVGDNGRPVCGVGSTNRSNGSSFSMRFEIGGQDVIFVAGKASWSIPEGRPVKVVMQIGQEAPWTETATGHDHQVTWTLDSNAIQLFDQQFRRAQMMTLIFPDGNEPPWTIPLNGSTAISNAFGRCVTDLSRRVQSPPPAPTSETATQPFADVPETTAPPPQAGQPVTPTSLPPLSQPSSSSAPGQPPPSSR